MRVSLLAISMAMLFVCLPVDGQTTHSSEDLEFFEKSIRPLLALRCFECHSDKKQESDLRLDHISTILIGGERGPALVPGDTGASRIVTAVTYEDPEFQMPPKEMLEDEEIDLLIEWVERGAPWPDEPPPAAAIVADTFDLEKRRAEHWAWQPVKRSAPPEVRASDWPLNDADRFILARLESEGLRPAPQADRRTIIRRLSFDLIGLPPKVSEISAYLKDNSAGAYDSLVDRLLASPHFGERWGRHWLDLVRFAESYGHEGDYPIDEAWRYRDYVIRALNADVPYNRFVREHIAGDVLKRPRMHPEEGYNESVIGTGWWYMHQATHAPVDVAKDEADRIDNQIDVLSKAFLGMTVACARCHDHKFDAISSEDYYSLSAFMRASRQHFAYLDPKGRIAAAVHALGDIQAEGKAELGRALEKISRGAAFETREYLMASRDVLYGTSVKEDTVRPAPGDQHVFEDFEGGSYDGWAIEGDAFGNSPPSGTLNGQQRVSGFEGRALVNSYRNGDGTTGTMTSAEFELRRPYIHFLIGGGDHPKKTCMNLLVDGEVVRTQTGRNDERLLRRTWDVAGLAGKRARLQIVDQDTGGWGHINIDQIIFSDVSASGARRLAAAPRLSPAGEGVFEDFEGGSYDGWAIEGDAFGISPPSGTLNGQQRVSGFEGQGLVNSFRNGDGTTGTMTSAEFELRQPYIHFLIGGGDHPKKTCINLLVDGKVVRTQTGRNNERLLWRTWDVGDLEGKQAQLQIVDQDTGGWGHINIDQITFSKAPVPGIRRSLDLVARTYRLDAERLVRWVRALQSEEVHAASHPLFAWGELAGAQGPDFAAQHRRLAGSASGGDASRETVVFETFDAPGYGGWFVTGEAFGSAPTEMGDWQLGPDGGGFVAPGVAHSGRLSSKLRGTLRSPTFTLNHSSIHYRVKGHDGQIRLIIGRYQLREFNGILFENTYVDADSDVYIWHHQVGGLEKWKGLPAYIEIIDDGNGYIAVDEIRFSNQGPDASKMSKRVQELVQSSAVHSHESLAGAYAQWTEDSLRNWRTTGLDADSSDWLNFLWNDRLIDFSAYEKQVAKLAERAAAIERDLPDPMRVLAITDGTVEDAHVFIRGNHGDLGKAVTRRFIEAIDPAADPLRLAKSGRLVLANRIAADDNPLFARVMVNRIWHHLFGRGIVESTDNFGLLGTKPSHPELLDYLAFRFREDGYSIKSTIRMLVTSQTYRMASTLSGTETEERDPRNVLLHRASIKRLESEIVRDAILAASGTLDETLFGPSVKAYLSPFMTYHRRPSSSGPMDGDRRRTIYLEVKRNFLQEMQLAFDMPLPDSTTGKRTVSNVPAQSLILMNDPFVAEQAKAWGEKLAGMPRSAEERVRLMCERAWGRAPSAGETSSMLMFLATQAMAYESDAADPKVWTDLVQVMFMAKEFIFIG